MRRIVDRLLRTTAAALVLTMPAQAAGVGVYYRQNPVTFDTPIPLAGETPAPVQSGPLSIETAGSENAYVGEAFSLRFTAKGGKSSTWAMSYTGARPAWLNVAESGSEIVLSAAAVPAGSTGTFSVSLTDGTETVTSSKTLAVVPALVLTSAKGASTGLLPNAAWNFAFDVSGGRGPYTLALTTPVAGNLAGIVATPAAAKLTLTGSAPIGSYPMTVRATDANGKTKDVTLVVAVDNPKPASGAYPSRLIDPTNSVSRTSTDQPDWNVLYDNSDSSQISSGTNGEAGAAGIGFDIPVTFNTITYRGYTSGALWIEENGVWVYAGSVGNGTTTLTKSYTATGVKVSTGYYPIYELRPGGAPATTAVPTFRTGASQTVPPGQTAVAAASDFTTLNPYAKSISLSGTPTSQNGVTLLVSETSVTVVGRPVSTTDVFVWAKDDTGLRSYVKFQVQGTGNGTLSYYARPTALINPNGGSSGVSRANVDQPDWNVLVDGVEGSQLSTGANNEAGAAGVAFSTPVTFRDVGYRGYGGGALWVLENGTWIQAGSVGNGTTTLSRPYTATAVKVSNGYLPIYELRVGNTPAVSALPTIVAGTSQTVPTSRNQVAASSDFATVNPYATSISLAKTPTNQNGVVLSVSAGSVTVATRPAMTTDVYVWVDDDTGMRSYFKFQVQAAAGASVSYYERPSALINPNGGSSGVTRATVYQLDWNVLVDGVEGSQLSTGSNNEAGAAGVTFAKAVTFQEVGYRGYGGGALWVLENGAWVYAGSVGNGTTTLARPYTATAVKVSNGYYPIYELRVGNTPAVGALPVLANGASQTVPSGQSSVATTASFTTANVYAASLSLEDTPTNQNGVVLSVSAGSVSVQSRPANTTDVFVWVKDDTGMKTAFKFQVQASGSVSTYQAPNGIINPNGGSSGITRTPAGQPDWNVLVDGNDASQISTGANSEAGAAGVTFASPVTFQDVAHKGYTSGALWILENGTWVVAGSVGNGTTTLSRPYAATAIKVSNGYYPIYELRVGGTPAVAY